MSIESKRIPASTIEISLSLFLLRFLCSAFEFDRTRIWNSCEKWSKSELHKDETKWNSTGELSRNSQFSWDDSDAVRCLLSTDERKRMFMQWHRKQITDKCERASANVAPKCERWNRRKWNKQKKHKKKSVAHSLTKIPYARFHRSSLFSGLHVCDSLRFHWSIVCRVRNVNSRCTLSTLQTFFFCFIVLNCNFRANRSIAWEQSQRYHCESQCRDWRRCRVTRWNNYNWICNRLMLNKTCEISVMTSNGSLNRFRWMRINRATCKVHLRRDCALLLRHTFS